jgi:large subunit ribosomal protein L28
MPPRCQLLPARLSTPQTIARPSQPCRRTFATSDPAPVVKNPLRRRKGGDLGSHLPKHVIPPDSLIPPYPYGEHALFKQANHGLYGEQMIQFGNNVSEKTETKTRRNWKPNVLNKSLYSVAMKKKIKLRITSRVLKTMDREGGLDEYLLKDSEHRLKELGPLGWTLRWTLMQKPVVIDRMRAKAAALGLDQASIDAQWPTHAMLVEQNVSQPVSQTGLVKASDLVGEVYNEVEEETEESYTKAEKLAMLEAGAEYKAAIKAAERYVARAVVNSEESALKLAFIRAKDRVDAAERNRQNFADKLEAQFSAQDVEATRTKFNLPSSVTDERVREIAYRQWRQQQIDDMGSYEAWRAKLDAEKAEKLKTIFGEDFGNKTQLAATNEASIAEAETAATNKSLKASQRTFFQNAMKKAAMAIKAKAGGGKPDYEAAVVQHMRGSRQIVQNARPGRDAWAALVNANNSSSGSRLGA